MMIYYEIWVRVRYNHPYKDELLDLYFDTKLHRFESKFFTKLEVLEYAKKVSKSNPMFQKVTVLKVDEHAIKEIKQ